MYLYFFKLVHLIGFVSWMAGLFYLGRMFVHHVESLQRPEPERSILGKQFSHMERLVWRIILNPAHIITWVAGIAMLIINPAYLSQGWMHLKLTLVILLTGYHHLNARPMRQLALGLQPMSSFNFRLWNEVPTIFLVAIAALGIYQYHTNYLYWGLALVTFTTLIYVSARAYQRKRLSGQRT